MSIQIYRNNDQSVDFGQTVEKNHGFETWEIIQAIENYTIDRCVLIAASTFEPVEYLLKDLKHPKPVSVDDVPDDVEIPDQDNIKNHKTRSEGDEYVCIDCGKRWGFDDPNVPDCN